MEVELKNIKFLENIIRHGLIVSLTNFLKTQGRVYRNVDDVSIYGYIPGNTDAKRESFLGKKDFPKYLTSLKNTKRIFQNALKRILLLALTYLIEERDITVIIENSWYHTTKFATFLTDYDITMLLKIFSDKDLISKMVNIIHINLNGGILKINSFKDDEEKDKFFFQNIFVEKFVKDLNIIRNWWIDIYYSPYTEIGKKRLKASYDKLVEEAQSSCNSN